MASVAIAILNYNGQKFLKQFLPTLLKYSSDIPIYVGDNASTDNSVTFLKTNFSQIHLVELNENFGYSKGYNQLIKHINTDYIALVNSDIEVTKNWLLPLIHTLDIDEKVAAVQPKIKSFHNKEYFEYAGAAGGFIDKYGYPFCRGRIFDTFEKDRGQYDNNIDISWASGACFLVRKSAFEQVGAFDDDFFAHMEEIDLCWRFAAKGYSIKYTYESTVYHVGGGTLAYESSFKTFLNFRNGLYLLLKNVPKNKLRKTICTRILLDWLSAFYFLLQGKGKQIRAILKAHKEVYKTRKQFLAKRLEPLNHNLVTENFSVVWNYFLKGKKTFDELPDNYKRLL